jgi:nitrogen fixation/metabolism regulation signal transduction histidine kinase
LRKGFFYTLISLAAATWLIAILALIYSAHRISRPIRKLTAGLTELSNGNLSARLPEGGNDEIATAMRAFNRSAQELQESQDRLVHFTRLSSWQTLARKMAHEVKNSLTPIRLTMEEIAARGSESDPRFLEQAAQIVVDEVGTLERRVRAFSDFAAEPPIEIGPVDVNALMEERVAFLRSAHPEVVYNVRLAEGEIKARADADLLKGVLTNLLENAAEAAGGGGKVLGTTFIAEGKVGIEVHDSGPGLSPHARGSLFEPTISFKKAGMGLGLSIARKSALLSGGDILLVEGELGGAAFRVLLPTG